MKVLEIIINYFPGYQQIIRSTCINDSGKSMSGVITNKCNFTINKVTNIPLISSFECFQKMKYIGGVSSVNFTNTNDNICLLEKERYDYISNLVENRILEANIIIDKGTFNISFIVQFLITALLISCFFLLMVKCFNRSTINNRILSFPTILIEPQHDQQERSSPQRRVNDVLATQNDLSECSICIEHIKPNSSIVKLSCGHIFHPECIKQWFQGSKRCPNCNDIGEPNRVILPSIVRNETNTPLLDND